MTPQQITLVRETYARFANPGHKVGLVFYQRLFDQNPSMRGLFHGDLSQQARELMVMMDAIVQMLDAPSRLGPMLYALGRRHAGYGVTEADFEPFGRALVDAVQILLGPACTAEVRSAWEAAYSLLAHLMVEAVATPPIEVAGGTTPDQRPSR